MTDLARQGPTVWARLVLYLISWAKGAGVDPDGLLCRTEYGPVDLEAPDSRIPLVAYYDLMETVSESLGTMGWAPRFTASLDFADLDALGFLMATSPTLGDAFERMLQYQRLYNDGEHFAVETRGRRCRISYEPFGPTRPAHGIAAEMTLYDIVVNSERILGQSVGAELIRFRHSALDGVDYPATFGAAVEFGALTNEAVIDAAALDIPMPEANAAMCRFFEQQVKEKVRSIPGSWPLAARVRDLVDQRLHAHNVGLAELASSLHMSARTLQRHLHQEGTSLAEIVDDVRQARAHAFLATRMALSEISYLLGYSEPSAFHHAFKRWTGQTPQQYREHTGPSVTP